MILEEETLGLHRPAASQESHTHGCSTNSKSYLQDPLPGLRFLLDVPAHVQGVDLTGAFNPPRLGAC